MPARKIYVCTTFREFNGDANAKIQEHFLKSLKDQTHTDWELIVTTFGEQNVKATLEKHNIPYQLFEKGRQDYRFSLTDVVVNGIDCLEKTGGILMWTTADTIFPSDFLAEVSRITTSGVAGTSHPHLIHENLADYRKGKFVQPTIYEGFDLIFFDDSVLLKKGGKKLVESYRFIDWGVFECFMVGIANTCARKKINLWQSHKVAKIANDRAASNETHDYFETSHNKNLSVFKKFLADTHQSKLLATLVYCNMCFRPLNFKKHWEEFGHELKGYYRDQRQKMSRPALLRDFLRTLH